MDRYTSKCKSRKILFAFLFVFFAIGFEHKAFCYDFGYTYRGATLYYNITDEQNREVELTYQQWPLDDWGSIVLTTYADALPDTLYVPAVAVNEQDTFRVTAVGELALILIENLRSVVLPEGIVSIGNYSMCNNNSLSEIVLPSTVRTLGEGCFSSNPLIGAIDLPSNIVYIGPGAFNACSTLSDIVLPEGLDIISHDLFRSCRLLRSINIPDNVKEIQAFAFAYTAIDTIIIPEGVLYLDNRSFSNMRLREVNIPSSVKYIWPCVFENCTNLRNITVSSGNNRYISCDGVLYNITKDTLCAYPIGKPDTIFQIPSGVRYIYAYSFSYSRNLHRVKFPDGLKSTGGGCFFESSITDAVFPDNMDTIQQRAFMRCHNLKEVTFGANLKYIDEWILSDCNNLERITSHSSVPPTLREHIIDSQQRTVPVYVPCESLDAYRNAPFWSDFLDYRCITGIGIDDTKPDIEIETYPNPTIDKITVSATVTIQRIAIHSLSGHKILETEPYTTSTTLDVTTLPQGTYLLRIKTDNWTGTKKIVVE